MTKTYCDRCGTRIGEEVGMETVNVSVTAYDKDGNVVREKGESGEADLCRPCADVVLKAMEPIPQRDKLKEATRG